MECAKQENLYENLCTSCNGFSNAFHKELSLVQTENIVSSPLSVHTILSLLSHGAAGTTLSELTTALRHGNLNTLSEEFKSIISLLNGIENVKLYMANAMYIQNGLQLSTEFLSTGTDIFKSLVSHLDFKNSMDAANQINSWVKTATNDKITDLIESRDVNEDTKLILLNAVYFNGNWLHRFDVKNTQLKMFHTTKTEQKKVPMMFKKASYYVGAVDSLHATFVRIPYMNENITMIIILPNEVDGLQALENNFDWEDLKNASETYNELELYLPRFKFEVTIDLKGVLQKMGLNSMFEDNADFSRLTDMPLKVGKVLHKAVIEVNEEGTEAAAATVVQMRLKRMIYMPEEFVVNRPFMFIIEHAPSKLPLFVGSVRDIKTDPVKEEL